MATSKRSFPTRSFACAGLVTVAAGIALTTGVGTASAASWNQYRFVDGVSCDPAEGYAKVIAETDSTSYVICQKHGTFPPDVYMVSELKVKPVPGRSDDVGFGPGTYVVNRDNGVKVVIGSDYLEIHDAAGNVTSHEPSTVYKFEL